MTPREAVNAMCEEFVTYAKNMRRGDSCAAFSKEQIAALLGVAEAAARYRDAQGHEHEGFEAQDAARRAALGLDWALDALVKVVHE